MNCKLSIISTAYNSSDFIKGTIESVLNQKTDFSFEYIISDDGSSDNTVEIVNQIKKSHPKGESIQIILNDRNRGVMKNFFGAVSESRGDYLAFCDSDDVWSDPNKLTKQLAYLEKHKDCAITYHSHINKLTEGLDTNLINQFDESINQVVMTPQTSTMMVRGPLLRESVNENVVNEAHGPQNDQYLRFLLKDLGYFKLLVDIDPNLRVVHDSSVFSTVNKIDKKKNALHSWQTIYKYHGNGKNWRYLDQKVKGFQSAVHWLEYESLRSSELFKKALMYDIQHGLVIRKAISKTKKILLKPLFSIRKSVKHLRDQ